MGDQGRKVPAGEVVLAEGLGEGGEVDGREGEGPVLDEPEGGSSGNRVAELGQLCVEGVENLVVMKGEDLALEIAPLLRGEMLEAAKVEHLGLADAVATTSALDDAPVAVALSRGGTEVHAHATVATTYEHSGRVKSAQRGRVRGSPRSRSAKISLGRQLQGQLGNPRLKL